MAEPQLVADCVKAMRDAVSIPVTVKHRIGIDRIESYEFVRDFVGNYGRGRLRVFIVHARNAPGCRPEPRENREVPPLRYEFVTRLQNDFPALRFALNGGVTSNAQIESLFESGMQGVMVGREAYHHPGGCWPNGIAFLGAEAVDAHARAGRGRDGRLHGARGTRRSPGRASRATCWGCGTASPAPRRWRQVWSDHRLKTRARGGRRAANQARRAGQVASTTPPARARTQRPEPARSARRGTPRRRRPPPPAAASR